MEQGAWARAEGGRIISGSTGRKAPKKLRRSTGRRAPLQFGLREVGNDYCDCDMTGVWVCIRGRACVVHWASAASAVSCK